MARFFVGQRVRLARFPSYLGKNPHGCCIGDEGTVWGVGDPVQMSVAMDRVGTPKLADRDLFEPILPDGHRAGDYTNLRDLMDALSSGVPA